MSPEPRNLIKHHTATAYIVTTGSPRKILLLHHNKLDRWMPPGGHKESNENYFETIIREVKEETGVDIAPHLPSPRTVNEKSRFLTRPWKVLEVLVEPDGDPGEHYHIDFEYLIIVIIVPEQTVQHDLAEAKGIGWFTWEEVESLSLFDDIRVSSKEAIGP